MGEFEKKWTKRYPDSNLEEEIKKVEERRRELPVYGYLFENKKSLNVIVVIIERRILKNPTPETIAILASRTLIKRATEEWWDEKDENWIYTLFNRWLEESNPF